jgi:hypothetical protein
MFQIWTRTNSRDEWSLYGTFSSEREFRAELPNIRANCLYLQRRKVVPMSQASQMLAAMNAFA